MKWFLVTALLTCACACACSGDNGTGPEILYLTPATSTPGVDIDILGKHFCGANGVDAQGVCIVAPRASVHIGSAATIVRNDALRWLDQRITVIIPSDTATGATLITVSVEGLVSNAVDFEVVP